MAAFQSDIPSSPVAQVGDNFDVVELYRPAVAPTLVPDACSIEEERGEGSDTESGSYKRRRIEGGRSDAVGSGGDDDDEEAVDEPDDVGLTWASSKRVKRRKTRKHEGGCAYDEEVVSTPEANLTWTSKQVQGRQGKQHGKEGLGEDRKDTREEDRAFWELCLAYGYP